MKNLEPRIMSFVRQKIANDKEIERIRKEKADKEILFNVYHQLDRIFGKPLSAFQVATVIAHSNKSRGWKSSEQTMFVVDDFVFLHVRYTSYFDQSTLYVKSKKWYRTWYDTEYSAEKFLQLVEKGKI